MLPHAIALGHIVHASNEIAVFILLDIVALGVFGVPDPSVSLPASLTFSTQLPSLSSIVVRQNLYREPCFIESIISMI